jgi:hypothetical protein
MIVVNKGYTLKVFSSENDGDLPSIIEKTYQDKNQAIEIAKMCKFLFSSKNSESKGIGNCVDESEKCEKILDYVEYNPNLLQFLDDSNDQSIIETCLEYSFDLLGTSEFYISRVCHTCVIYYSPHNITVEEIVY